MVVIIHVITPNDSDGKPHRTAIFYIAGVDMMVYMPPADSRFLIFLFH